MIYIVGKVRGLDPEQVRQKFQKAEDDLRRMGLLVINPIKLGISFAWSDERQMEFCLKVIRQKVTGIYLLKDWPQSEGAKLEFLEVHHLNNIRFCQPIEIYYEEYHGLEFIKTDIAGGRIKCLVPSGE